MRNGFYWTRKLPNGRWLPSEWASGSWLCVDLLDCAQQQIEIGDWIPAPGESSVELYTSGLEMLSSLPFALEFPESPLEGSYNRVTMAGRNMIDETGVAEVCVVTYSQDSYQASGEGFEVGGFATENEAIAAFAKHLREKNKGKFTGAEEWAARGPEEPDATGYGGRFAPLMCPTCGVPPTKLGTDMRRDDFKCPKCGNRFERIKTGEMRYGLESVGHQWLLKAREAGFTEEQAEVIRKFFEALS
jgi:hypothetical protein